MYCPQCGVKAEQPTKFCKACGSKLSGHAQLLESSPETELRLRQEKWMTQGIMFLLIAVGPMLWAILDIARIVRKLNLPDGFEKIESGLSYSLGLLTGGILIYIIGAIYLVRSGFFKNLRERQSRNELALIEMKRKAATSKKEMVEVASEVETSHFKLQSQVEVSMLEDTTRELPVTSVPTRKIEGE